MSQRSLTIALFVSLAVNLFAIGGVVGGLVVGVRMSEGRASAMRPGPPPIFAAAKAAGVKTNVACSGPFRGGPMHP